MNTGPTAAYIANSPLAQKGYSAAAKAYLPKSAGWKAASGVKGGAIGIGTSLAANYLKTKSDPIKMGGDEFGAITDKYKRREQSAGPGYKAAMLERAGQGAQYGGWYGAAAGAVGGAIEAAAKKHAKSAYSDFLPDDARGAITEAYQKYLGRDPEAGAVDEWMTGQGWKPGDKGVGQDSVFGKLNQIKNSPEAMQRIPGGGINTAPTQMPAFTPNATPSSFLSPEQVAMLDENRRARLGY